MFKVFPFIYGSFCILFFSVSYSTTPQLCCRKAEKNEVDLKCSHQRAYQMLNFYEKKASSAGNPLNTIAKEVLPKLKSAVPMLIHGYTPKGIVKDIQAALKDESLLDAKVCDQQFDQLSKTLTLLIDRGMEAGGKNFLQNLIFPIPAAKGIGDIPLENRSFTGKNASFLPIFELIPDSVLLQIDGRTPSEGITKLERLRNTLADGYEKSVRLWIAGSQQLKVDKGPNAYTGTKVIEGLYQGNFHQFLEGFYLPRQDRLWGSCEVPVANKNNRWFKNNQTGSYTEGIQGNGEMVNHRCRARITSPTQIGVLLMSSLRGEIIDRLMKHMEGNKQNIVEGKIFGPELFSNEIFQASDLKYSCGLIASNILAIREKLNQDIQKNYSHAIFENMKNTDCRGQSVQAICNYQAAAIENEIRLTTQYLQCTWQTIAEEYIDVLQKVSAI